MDVDPHVVMFTFLPVLLFQSAFSADFHIMLHELKQILLLAGPGVLTSTFFTACYVKLCYQDWELTLCGLLGAILSATDPVAVVAMLKELGVDERLATLIEGESLLNDGTAIIVYTVFSKMIFTAYCCSGGQIVAWSLRLSVGGPIIGALVGMCVIYLLGGHLAKDVNSEVTLTVAACYACFMLAEGTDLHTSGVLAVVCCGLWLANQSKGKFDVKVEKSLEAFWHVAEYIADTVIFFVSGLIMARVLTSEAVEAYDWGVLFGLYVWVHIVRAFNVALFWRFIGSKSGYGKDWNYRQATILVMGGLRGAVGLALALVTEHELLVSDLPHHKKKSGRVLLHVAGLAFFTLVINGGFMESIIKYLGLDKVNKADEELFHHSCHIVEERLEKHVEDLRDDLFLGNADFQQVWRYLPIFSAEQYWSRIDKKFVKLDDTEKREAGVLDPGIVGSYEDPYRYCPPPLQELWKHYHKKYKGTKQDAHLSRQPLKTVRPNRFSLPSGKEAQLEREKQEAQLALNKANHALRKLKKEKVFAATRGNLIESHSRSLTPILSIPSKFSEEEVELFLSKDSRDRLEKGRVRYLTSLRAMYVSNHHSGRMRSSTLRYLLWSADEQLDRAELPLKDWEILQTILERGFALYIPTSTKNDDEEEEDEAENSADRRFEALNWALNCASKLPMIGPFVSELRKWFFFHQLTFIQEIANEFVYARQELDIHDLLDDNEESIKIEKEIEAQKICAFDYMRSRMQWPEIGVAINTMTAARQMLRQAVLKFPLVSLRHSFSYAIFFFVCSDFTIILWMSLWSMER